MNNEIRKYYKPYKPFSEKVINLLNDISSKLFANAHNREELFPIAFYCRKSNLLKVKAQYADTLCPCGVALFICPKNVDILSCWSLVFGLLTGNYTIIRPKPQSPIIDEFMQIFREVVRNACCGELLDNIVVLDPGDNKALATWSSWADVRVCWGGNKAISEYSALLTSIDCRNFYFAHRNSFTVINGDVLEKENIEEIAKAFFKYSYAYTQASCSSPRAVYFIHGKSESIRMFWDKLAEQAQSVDMTPALIISKYSEICKYVATNPKHVRMYGNKLYVIESTPFPWTNHTLNGFGVFYSIKANSIEECFNNLKQIQTVSYVGFDKQQILNAMYNSVKTFATRIVPLNEILEFDHIVDGVDIIVALTKQIKFK